LARAGRWLAGLCALAAALTLPGAALATAAPAYLSQFGSYGSGNGQFNGPYLDAVDPATGDVYVTDTGNSRVEKFDSSGDYISQFGSLGLDGNGEFEYPHGVAVDPSSGDVYVDDNSTQAVQKFDSSGKYLSQFGSFGGGNGQFGFPEGLAVDSKTGDVYVVDQENDRVEKFDSSGNYLSQFGNFGSGNGQFNFPIGVAVESSTGDVYVTDARNERVEKFDSSGSYLGHVGTSGSGNGQFAGPAGVAVDPRTGAVYVVDSGNNRVEQFDSSGNYLSQFGSSGTGNGQFNGPFGVAVDPKTGDVYVTDGNDRVEKFGWIATTLAAAPQLVLFPPPNGAGLGTVAATLTAGKAGVAGQTIGFSVGGTALCSAVTNASGVASCSPSAVGELTVLLSNTYTATFAANGPYLGSTARTPAVELGNGLASLASVRVHGTARVWGTLTRAGNVYALITTRTQRGHVSLKLKTERRLRAGRYVLTTHLGGRVVRRTVSIR
jgi:DNA-binding beta-propeller fold protein YncE